jgi:hypothetical protein
MTEEQFALFQQARHVITGLDLVDKSSRTLLYGFDYTTRIMSHVYLFNNIIYSVRYALPHRNRYPLVLPVAVNKDSDYVSHTSEYSPQRCDVEFTCLLAKHFTSITMKAFQESTRPVTYHAPYCGALLAQHRIMVEGDLLNEECLDFDPEDTIPESDGALEEEVK